MSHSRSGVFSHAQETHPLTAEYSHIGGRDKQLDRSVLEPLERNVADFTAAEMNQMLRGTVASLQESVGQVPIGGSTLIMHLVIPQEHGFKVWQVSVGDSLAIHVTPEEGGCVLNTRDNVSFAQDNSSTNEMKKFQYVLERGPRLYVKEIDCQDQDAPDQEKPYFTLNMTHSIGDTAFEVAGLSHAPEIKRRFFPYNSDQGLLLVSDGIDNFIHREIENDWGPEEEQSTLYEELGRKELRRNELEENIRIIKTNISKHEHSLEEVKKAGGDIKGSVDYCNRQLSALITNLRAAEEERIEILGEILLLNDEIDRHARRKVLDSLPGYLSQSNPAKAIVDAAVERSGLEDCGAGDNVTALYLSLRRCQSREPLVMAIFDGHSIPTVAEGLKRALVTTLRQQIDAIFDIRQHAAREAEKRHAAHRPRGFCCFG